MGLMVTLVFACSATLGPHRHCGGSRAPHPHLLLLHLQEVLLQEEEEQEGERQRHEERHEHEGHEVGQPGDVLLVCLALSVLGVVGQSLWLSYKPCQGTCSSSSREGWRHQAPGMGWCRHGTKLRQQHHPPPVPGGPDGTRLKLAWTCQCFT